MAISDGTGTPVTPNAWGTPHSTIENPFMFTGRQLDEEIGLHYYRARYYDPGLGRFISRDSLGNWTDAMNLGNGYAYVGNNPINYIDPYGNLARPGVYEPRAEILPFRPGVDEPQAETLPFRPGVDETQVETLPFRPGVDEPRVELLSAKPPKPEHESSFCESILEFIKSLGKAAADIITVIPGISTTETIKETWKAAPAIIERNQSDYEDWGDATGEWGPENPYYGLLGVKHKTSPSTTPPSKAPTTSPQAPISPPKTSQKNEVGSSATSGSSAPKSGWKDYYHPGELHTTPPPTDRPYIWIGPWPPK
jgi:RHS repeat-associated protein